MAWQVLVAMAVVTIGSYLLRRWFAPDKPQAEDPRAQYKPSPASFGQVLPLVYGTTMIPTPSLSRGRLVVNGSTWQQYQVVLGLCQGPITEVKSMWVSNGSEGDAGDAAQRIEWIRMTDAGASLQTGTINGHTGTPSVWDRGADASEHARGYGFMVATRDGSGHGVLRLVSRVFAFTNAHAWPNQAHGGSDGSWADIDYVDVQRSADGVTGWTDIFTLGGNVTAKAYCFTMRLYEGGKDPMAAGGLFGVWDLDGSATDYYRMRWRIQEGSYGSWSTPARGTYFQATGSFLPALGGNTVIFNDLVLDNFDVNSMPATAATQGKWLHGTFPVVSSSEQELVLDVTSNAEWTNIPVGSRYVFKSNYWATGDPIYYPGIAHVRANPLDLAKLYQTLVPGTTLTPSFQAEVKGMLATASDGLSANPLDVVKDLVGGNYWSANVGVTVETNVGTDGVVDGACSADRYIAQTAFYVSGVFNTQRSATEQIQSVLDACDCVMLDSEAKIKILPLGDETVGTFVPNTTPAASLTDSDFIAEGDTPAIELFQFPDSQRANVVSVEYRNRDAQGATYRISVETAYDPADIEEQSTLHGGTGKREANVAVLHWIATADHARKIAQLRLQRSLAVRCAQRFRLGFRHARLEGMDLLSLTEDNANLSNHSVRVAAVEETDDGTLTVETVDWPIGISGAVSFGTQPVVAPAPEALNPGKVDLPFVAAVPRYISGSEYAIWVGASGSASTYGGCDVYVSQDEVNYTLRGSITGRTVMGTVIDDFTQGDTSLNVDCVATMGALASATTAERDAGTTLAYIDDRAGDGEVVGLADVAAYAGGLPYRWACTNVRRGMYGTADALRAGGSRFVRLDPAATAYVTLPASAFGADLWIKFVPFSTRGDGRPDLATCPTYRVILPLPTVAGPTSPSLSVTDTAPAQAANQWRASADELMHAQWATVAWTMSGDLHNGFEVVLHEGTDPNDASKYVCPMRGVESTIRSAVLAVSAGASPLTVYAAVRAVYASGARSAWVSTSSGTIDALSNVAQNALTLAGTKTKVYYTASAPTLGVNDAGALWFSTDTTTVCPLGASCAGTKNDDGSQRSPATHRGLYWPHRWNDAGNAWTDTDRQALVIAGEIAAGAITADKIAANSIDVSHLTVGSFGDNVWPNPTSEYAPPTGASLSGAEFGYRDTGTHLGTGGAFAGTYARAVGPADDGGMWLALRIPARAGETYRFSAQAKIGQMIGGAAGRCYVYAECIGGAGSVASNVCTNATTYELVSLEITAVAGTTAIDFLLYVEETNYVGTVYGCFDNIELKRMVDASLIVAGQLRTSNYAESGGIPTAGAKLDHTGTALKVAKGNLQIGAYTFGSLMEIVSATMSGTNRSVDCTFAATEPDAGYACFAIPIQTSGSGIPANAFVITEINRQTAKAVLWVYQAPGTGNSVGWLLFRFRIP